MSRQERGSGYGIRKDVSDMKFEGDNGIGDELEFGVRGKRLELSYRGQTAGIRLNLGARYLWELLLHPHQSIGAAELYLRYHDESSGQDYLYRRTEQGLRDEGLVNSSGHSRMEMTDLKALREIRGRLSRIEADISETETWNDYRLSEDLLAERDAILRYLEETVSSKGKIRVFSNMDSRCRESVVKALKRVLERVGEQNREIAGVLRKRLSLRDPLCYEWSSDLQINR